MIRRILNRQTAILCLYLLTCACGSGKGRPTSGYVVGYLDGESAEVLDSAVSQLESATGEPFLSDLGSDYYIPITYSKLEGPTLGVAWVGDDEQCTIYIDESLRPENGRWSKDDLRNVIIHEIGHCMGLKHEEGSGHIMSAYYSPGGLIATAFSDFIQSIQRVRGRYQQARGR